MSFPKASLKRFNEMKGCAPPVGAYDPKLLESKKSNAFDKSDRFRNQKNEGPAPNAFDISTDIINYSGFRTPTKKGSFNLTMSEAGSKHASTDDLKAEISSLKKHLVSKDRQIKQLRRELDDTVITLLKDLQVFQAITLSLEEKIDDIETSQDGTDKKMSRTSVLTSEIAKVINNGNGATTNEKIELAKQNAKKLQENFQQVIAESEKKIEQLKVSMECKVTLAVSKQEELEKELYHVQENLKSALSCSETLQKYRDSLERRNQMLRTKVRTLDAEQLDLHEENRFLKGEVFAISDDRLQESQFVFESNAEIAELKEKLEQLEQEEQTLNSNIKTLTKKYQDLDATLATVKEENQQEMENLSAQLEVATNNLKKEKAECEALQSCNKDLLETVSQKQKEIDDLVTEVEKAKKEAEHILEQTTTAEDNIIDLEVQLEAARVELSNTKEIAAQHMKQIIPLEEKITCVETEKNKLLANLEQEKNMNQQTVRELTDRILALEQLEISLQEENSELKRAVDEESAATKLTESRIEELEIEIQHLEEKRETEIKILSDDKDKEILQALQDLHTIQAEIENLNQNLLFEKGEHSKDVLNLEESLLNSGEELLLLKKKMEDEEIVYKQILTEKNNVTCELQKQTEEWQEEKRTLLCEIENLTITKMNLDTEITNFNTEIGELTMKMNKMKLETDDHIAVLISKLEGITSEKMEALQQIKELELKVEEYQTGILALESKLQSAEIEVEQKKIGIAEIIETSEVKVKSIAKKLEFTEKCNSELECEKLKLEKDLLCSRDELKNHKDDIDNLKKNMDAMKLECDDEVLKLKMNMEKVEEERSDIAKSLAHFQDSETEYEIQVSTLKRKLQISEMESEQKIFDYSVIIEKTKNELALVSEKFETLQQKYSKLEDETTQRKNDYIHSEKELEQCRIEFQIKVAEKDDKLGELERECCGMREKNDELNHLVGDLRFEISELENSLGSTNARVQILQMENKKHDELQSTLHETSEQLELVRMENDKQALTIDHLQSNLLQKDQNLEDLKEHINRLQVESEDVISNMERLHAAEISHLQSRIPCQEEEDRIKHLNELVDKWQTMYEALQQKVEPFMKQLDAFEIEKHALLGRSKDAQSEMEKLSQRYAQLLGHQNQKQKIHHIVKIKDENNLLKREISALRENELKHKRTIQRLEEKLSGTEGGRKKFDPSKAFKHAKEDRTQTMLSPLKEEGAVLLRAGTKNLLKSCSSRLCFDQAEGNPNMSDHDQTPSGDESDRSGSVKSDDSPASIGRKPAAHTRQKVRSASRSRSRSPYHSRSRSRSHSRNRAHTSRRRPKRSYSRSRSRSYHKYSRSRSRSPHYRRRSRDRGRYSPYYQDNGYSRDRRRRNNRSGSRSPGRGRYIARDTSPMSSRRRHIGNRDNPNPTRCLGVFGLSLYTQERDLRDVFSRYGSVEEVQVVYDRQSGRSRGFAFIHFRTVDDSIEAKDRCTGIEIDGRRIRVDYSITERAHTPTPGIYLGKPTTGGNSSGSSNVGVHRDQAVVERFDRTLREQPWTPIRLGDAFVVRSSESGRVGSATHRDIVWLDHWRKPSLF
ncbi:hypothetical protein ScPMuIL_016224 [Solemya velum]